MVIRSSCVLPPSERRRNVLRRLSSITLCWRSISRRMRRRSGDASSLNEPSGFKRDRSERARLASCAPSGSALSAFSPVTCAATLSGGLSISACQAVMLSTRNSRSRILPAPARLPGCAPYRSIGSGQTIRPTTENPLSQHKRISLARVCCCSIHKMSREGFIASSQARATEEWAKLATSSSSRAHSSASQLHSSTTAGTASKRPTKPMLEQSRTIGLLWTAPILTIIKQLRIMLISAEKKMQ